MEKRTTYRYVWLCLILLALAPWIWARFDHTPELVARTHHACHHRAAVTSYWDAFAGGIGCEYWRTDRLRNWRYSWPWLLRWLFLFWAFAAAVRVASKRGAFRALAGAYERYAVPLAALVILRDYIGFGCTVDAFQQYAITHQQTSFGHAIQIAEISKELSYDLAFVIFVAVASVIISLMRDVVSSRAYIRTNRGPCPMMVTSILTALAGCSLVVFLLHTREADPLSNVECIFRMNFTAIRPLHLLWLGTSIAAAVQLLLLARQRRQPSTTSTPRLFTWYARLSLAAFLMTVYCAVNAPRIHLMGEVGGSENIQQDLGAARDIAEVGVVVLLLDAFYLLSVNTALQIGYRWLDRKTVTRQQEGA